MCNLLVQVFRRILRTLISLSMTVRLTAHLTRRRSRRLMNSTYFREISCRTLSWWVKWHSIRVRGPSVPNMRLLERCHTIPLVRPPECPRRKHRPTQDTSYLVVKSDQETHTTCLSLGGCFISVDVFLFYFISETVIYIFILFERLYFIFFIYVLKFSFSYFYFDINFL
jgi:hypothetical protein